jgi:hypothetical protein
MAVTTNSFASQQIAEKKENCGECLQTLFAKVYPKKKPNLQLSLPCKQKVFTTASNDTKNGG